MELTVKQDLVNAKSKHYLFKSKMRAYLDGSKDVPEEVLADFNACVLGKWINEVGKVKYGEYAEVQALDATHQRIHQKANEIIALKKAGDENAANAKMEDIDQIGSEIIDCIETLEAKFE
ncbi:MAG: CZB domain-containing protein [Microscillaceae bacterium]|jgi:methyl-accepting chemotaxis protein|nr:CZB domain-containing protein [Microscillaceae bacterium]